MEMSKVKGRGLLALVTLLATIPCSAQVVPGQTVKSDPRSSRIVEHLRLRCDNSLGIREITLFGNGTLRLRDGLRDAVKMWLHELRPSERDAYLARLGEEELRETEPRYHSIEGEWIENCELHLDLPGQLPQTFEFGRYDSLSLALQRTVGIAQELIAVVDQTRRPAGESEIPASYEPRIGDLLTNDRGHRYRLVMFTADGEGAELQGLDQPLTMYLPLSGLREEFVSVEPRRR